MLKMFWSSTWDSERNYILFQNSVLTFQSYLSCSVTFCLAMNYFSARSCMWVGAIQAQITPQKAIGSVKHDFPFIDPCWLFLATSLSLMCFKMVSSSIYSIIFPGIEVRLAGLLFPGPFFLPSLKTGGAFTFFQCLSTSPDHNKILKTIKNGIRLTSASSHSTCRCTPAGSMYLYVSGSRGRASALKLLPGGEVSL